MAGEWKSAIPQSEWELYEAAGFGRKSGLGQRPAILVIDVQYRTVGDEPLPQLESMRRFYKTSCGDVGWAAVDKIATVLAAGRASNVPVIYPHVAQKTANEVGRTGEKIPSLWEVAGRGYQFVAEVAPKEGDLLIPKRHPSAFFATALVSNLIDLGVDTLLLTGCTTSGCIRATAIDAFAYNFRCGVVEECVYDRSPLSHNVNLFDLQAKYADVVGVDDAITYLQGAGREAPMALVDEQLSR